MKITQIRNATQIITYAGKRFLIDPMLAPKGAWPGFPGTAHAEIRNPMVDLPFGVDKIVDVDAVIVTHTHEDHWDQAALDCCLYIIRQRGGESDCPPDDRPPAPRRGTGAVYRPAGSGKHPRYANKLPDRLSAAPYS